MQQYNQENPTSESIDISQWRREINTFVNEMQGELSGMIDELSNTFSAVESPGSAWSQPLFQRGSDPNSGESRKLEN